MLAKSYKTIILSRPLALGRDLYQTNRSKTLIKGFLANLRELHIQKHYRTGFFCSLIFGKTFAGESEQPDAQILQPREPIWLYPCAKADLNDSLLYCRGFLCSHYIQKPIQHDPHFEKTPSSNLANICTWKIQLRVELDVLFAISN